MTTETKECRCIKPPYGNYGLAGFDLGVVYYAEKVTVEATGKVYWRIYKHRLSQYQMCNEGVFNTYFEEVK